VQRILKRALALLGVIALTLLGVRAWDAQRGDPLQPWHTFVPDELDADEIDRSTWNNYLEAERAVFDEVRAEVTGKLDSSDRVPFNRYYADSPMYPGRFAKDWNHSYILQPDGAPAGAAVFLHGLTDSPYSMRHIAERYRQQGFVCVVIRMPGHGTVPGGLTGAEWEDWMAATRLAVREGRHRSGPELPLHLIGYSNGGALALTYALMALDDSGLPRPERLVLISPMVGVTAFARFAGLAGLPAIFPAFARAAWISIVPEFNPFKFNSFPVNAARQSYLLTDFLQGRIRDHARRNGLANLPAIITFQSVVDFTVSTQAIADALYNHLPDNGSELVLFDINRRSKLGPLLRSSLETAADRLLPQPPRRFTTATVTNGDGESSDVVERVVEAGATAERVRTLHLTYPRDVYSLSHVALPFPTSDPLYGLAPEGNESFGISLGTVAARGEREALIVSLDWLLRINSNPFFSYMSDRIAAFSAQRASAGR
jgi:alpha-beta hydrolase superfamily lysophospholipase